MINLLLSLLIVCSSFGYAIARTSTTSGTKKHRQHTTPLSLDKELT